MLVFYAIVMLTRGCRRYIMKLLKGTIAAFAVTALLSSVGVNAESIWHFAGLTLEGHSRVYNSSTHIKDIESNQYFKNVRAFDNEKWVERAMKVAIKKMDTGSTTGFQELNTGVTGTYSGNTVKHPAEYRVKLKTANPFSNDVYFNGIWYLDNTRL